MATQTPQIITPGWTTFPLWVRRAQNIAGNTKEAMYLRVSDPYLSGNIGKFHFSHIWNVVLFNIPDLHLK